MAASKTYAPDDTPSLSLSAAIGGSGGLGGNGYTAQITNAGMIATSGAGGIGMIAQSIGGGGGAGGDSSASSSATGSEVNIAASVALGGHGGSGGNSDAVNATNTGLIVTTGESADGMLAQSIGGGGGNGGSGDAQATTSGDGTGISASIPIGGKSGGGGSVLGLPQANNSGAILTLGDGASGIIAQAIGGGGGRAGGAAGTTTGDFSATVSVGGSGGSGGSASLVDGSNNPTASVLVTNSGSIVTFGADAPAIVAQSIGGGGGLGGKSATSIGSKKSTGDGGNGSSATNPTLDALAAAFKAGGDTSQYTSVSALSALANQLLGNTQTVMSTAPVAGASSDSNDLEDLGESQGDAGDGSEATSIEAKIAVGGTGGAAGNGGIAQVTNTGSIGTVGAMSDGILAQSIGGGGGKGGAATSSGSLSVDEDSLTAPLAVGGKGGASGSGSDVTVTNDTNASITTIGSLANGIVAQSIGGGGGMGGIAGGRNGALQGVNVSNRGINIGGDQIGTSGDASTVTAGTVTVNNNAGASILTESHDASGIIVQSIGAGGGIVKVLSTDAADNAGGGANPDPVKSNGAPEISIVFGGTNSDGANGSGGAAIVNNSGSITTQGRNSYGMLAQSIGGGGGLVLGGEIGGGPGGFMNTAAMRGNGGVVSATTFDGSSIATSGAGAVGIFAQSVGGGGGIAGDTGLSQLHLSYSTANNHPGSGDGGAVLVAVNAGSSVQTSGPNAPAIVAQSVGGGGGWFTAGASSAAQGLYAGSFGGSGAGGAVNVAVSGSVSATGAASPGIYAQSSQAGGRSTSGQAVTINVNQGGTVSGGTDFYHGGDGTAAGIQIFDGYYNANGPANAPANIVNVNGVVTSVAGANGSGVFSYGGTTFVHNGPTGTIDGVISLQNNGGNGSVQNDPGGKLNTGSTVAAALLQNNGTLDVGGVSAPVATTLVTGNLVQGSTGSIVVDTDHVAGTSDRLTVAGDATLAGQLVMRPTRLSNSPVEVIDVGGKLDASQLSASNPYLVNYALSSGSAANAVSGAQIRAQQNAQTNEPSSVQTIYVTPHAKFAASSAGLSANAQSVASHLQANFDAGANALGTSFAQMANGIQDHASYAAALDRLGNETQQAVGTTTLAVSHAFVERMYTCPTFDGPSNTMMHEHDCVWGRIIDNHTSADGSNSLGYSANGYAMQFGGQHGIGDGWFVGGSVGYDTTNLDGSDGVGDVNGHGPQMGIVLKKEVGNWTFSGGVSGGYSWYDSTRNVMLPGYAAQAKGAFNAYETGLHTRVAYTLPMNDWYVKPYVDVHLVHMHTDSYTEQGAGALDLAVNSANATTLSASPMVEVGGRWTFANGMTLRPDLAVGGVFLNRNHWDANAQFVGSAPGVAPFSAVASAPSSLAKVKVDMNLSVSKSTELKLEYGGQFGSGYSSNEGILRVNYLF
ncbi:MAG TPA: autotransporter domain-containing protein [Stellaceae bacterium]|nr:autotransporter domain-containing protein [Stellaceae bacterium]